jgi:hypothetical protein
MKKIVIPLIVLFFAVQGYAQCKLLPFKPTFGTVGSADTADWLMFSDRAAALRPSYWQFRTVNSEGNAIVPYLFTRSEVANQTVTLYSPCIELDHTKTYELKFTLVGLTPRFMNGLRVYLAVDAPLYSNNGSTFSNPGDPYNNTAPAADTFRLINSFSLPFGKTEVSAFITDFPPTGLHNGGKYRIVFKSGTVGGQIQGPPAPGEYYTIESYLKTIEVKEVDQYELEVVGLNNPLSKCDLTHQIMSFKVKNRGYSTPANYNVCYQMSIDDGVTFGTPICEPFSTPIPFGGIVDLNFQTPRTFDAQRTLVNAWIENHNGSDTLKNAEIRLTTAQNIPYGCSFDNFAVFRDWSIIPGKTIQSDVTWHVPLNTGGAMAGRVDIATSGATSNDRLVSPCIELEANKPYKISVTYNAHSSRSTENLRFYVGQNNSPDASDLTLMDFRGFNHTDSRTMTVYFKPTETKNYFFGFLAYSDSLSGGISIRDLTIMEAEEPAQVPVYMGFENYDNPDGWQRYSPNTIDSTGGSNTPRTGGLRGWSETTTPADAFTGQVALRTVSAPTIGVHPQDSVVRLAVNNNWIMSKPIFMEAGNPYEILYFRKTKTNGVSESLNVYVANNLELQSLSESPALFNDVFTSGTYSPQKLYFTPSVSGTYFVLFQYNTPGRHDFGGMFLDEIAIQDSASAQDTNLSVISLTLPDPSCSLSRFETLRLTIKNRTGDTIPTSTLRGFFSITHPDGDQTTVPSNSPSGGFFNQILPYQTGVVERQDVRMDTAGVWEVVAWISGDLDKNSSDDTSAVMTTVNTGTLGVRYDMGFEPNPVRPDQSINYWTSNRVGNSKLWWQFTTNPAVAFSGVGAAHIAPSTTLIAATDSNSQYISSPCFKLSSDTTYFISFYYRATSLIAGNEPHLLDLEPTVLNLYVGPTKTPINSQLKYSVSATDLNYQQAIYYYRPTVTAAQEYITFEAVSKRYSTGIYLDNFVIMDSVAATMPNLSLNKIWAVSSDNCDLSDDTLYVEIQNTAYLPCENPKFTIKFGDRSFEETWYEIIPIDATRLIKLNTSLAHTKYGESSVNISLNVPGNISKDTSVSTQIVKSEIIENLPYTTSFRSADISLWNNLEIPFSVNPATFEYWTFGLGLSTANSYAHFENGITTRAKPGILATPCFSLIPDETYEIVYQYRGIEVATAENLHVLRENNDGTIENLHSNTNIRTATYSRNSVPFVATGDERRFRFLSNYHYQSKGLYINQFTIKIDTSAWPADAELVRLVSPISRPGLTVEEPIIIEVANLNRRPLHNLHVYYSIDGRCPSGDNFCHDSIPALAPGDTIQFAFRQRAYLGDFKDYKIVAFVDVDRDLDRLNDTVRETVTNQQVNSIFEYSDKSVWMIYPNPATTEVFVKSEKEISTLFIYDMRGQPVKEIRINNTEYHINTSDFSAGTYLFSFQIGNERFSQKVVINNQP